MTSKYFQSFSLSAAALVAAFAFPAVLCAQTASVTNTVTQASASKVAAKPRPVPHRRKLVPDEVSVPARMASQLAEPDQAQSVAPAVSAQATDPSTPAANAPVQPVVSGAPNTARTTATDPASQVQNGIQQVNARKQKAKSIWGQLKNIKK